MSRRRPQSAARAAGRPDVRGHQFSDASDLSSPTGGPLYSPSDLSLPRGNVRRSSLLDALISERSEEYLTRGYGGARFAPMLTRAEPASSSNLSRRARSALRLAALSLVRSSSPPRLTASQKRADWRAFQSLRVAVPSRVRFCQQRKARKEVLFAKKVAGKKGGSHGSYRRTEASNWSC